MHYFIFPLKDSYITEDSAGHIILYPDSSVRNYGADEILELKKEFVDSYSSTPYNVSRILTQFDYSDISASIVSGDITNPKFYLRYYGIEGQTELNKTYSLSSFPLSQSWDEGTGKHFDNPKTTNGVTWQSVSSGSDWVLSEQSVTFGGYSFTFDSATSTFRNYGAESGSRPTTGGGVWYVNESDPDVYSTGNGFESSQSFQNQSSDIEMDVTNIVNNQLGGSNKIQNNGIITKFSGSLEDDGTSINLKFFSRNTHTIYSPKLEVRWNDVTHSVGSLTALTMSGELENHIFIKGLQPTYRESEKVRFRLGCRKKYVQKTFTESMLTSSFYIPSGDGVYSIVDVATDTPKVPFSAYTSMSCDANSMYFDQWLNTFEPGRYYKVLFKLKYEDGQEIIYDNNEEFKVI